MLDSLLKKKQLYKVSKVIVNLTYKCLIYLSACRRSLNHDTMYLKEAELLSVHYFPPSLNESNKFQDNQFISFK